MSKIDTGHRDLGYYVHNDQEPARVLVEDAPDEAVRIVLEADPDHDDGRSQWVWIRFPNGDLFLAVAPQGDTYLDAWEGTQ